MFYVSGTCNKMKKCPKAGEMYGINWQWVFVLVSFLPFLFLPLLFYIFSAVVVCLILMPNQKIGTCLAPRWKAVLTVF